MLKADNLEVTWESQKRAWQVRIQAGEEVVKRPIAGASRDADEATLRSLAIQTAQDDGYDGASAAISISR